MNWDEVAGNWKRPAGQLKDQWGKLTEDNLTTIAVKRDQFAGLPQERYGQSDNQVDRELDEFAKGLKP